MIDWTQQRCFTSRNGHSSNKSPMIFPLVKWWHNLWYTEIQDVIPLTLFDNKTDRVNIDPDYWTVSLSTVTAAQGFKFTFSQALAIAAQPNYLQQSTNHFFLAASTTAAMESKRMNQALVNLSRNVLDYILNNFLPDHPLANNGYSSRIKSTLSQPLLANN
jgi:hypothetical protein